MVGRPAVAQADGRVSQRDIDRPHLLARRAFNRHRPGPAVIRGMGEIRVRLQPDETRQHLPKRPAGTARLRPAVIVLWHAADRHLDVHRRTAAQALTARTARYPAAPTNTPDASPPAPQPTGSPGPPPATAPAGRLPPAGPPIPPPTNQPPPRCSRNRSCLRQRARP